MGTIGIVLHPERSLAGRLASQTIEWAEGNGHQVRLVASEAARFGLERLGRPDADFARNLDLAVCFGGDGTMLRTVGRVAPYGVPILGVNVGQLGYLSAIEPSGLIDALERFFSGRYQVEERMQATARVDFAAGGTALTAEALNEIVLEKTPMGHTVRIAVYLDGEFFTTYAADGLIVATPTGSTAYSFSSRGPIVAPSHRALILTPVSPHMLFDRALVLGPDTIVRLELVGPRPGMLLADGQMVADLTEGDAVVCTGSQYQARLVRFDGSDFHRVLKSKFGLNDR
ncbi:MAG TPA: NAD(+)/NADH kinase [Acidimicrobiales bacterium]|nr:NAD(+)/NADH kinase [Acidimicrobiales bacterium]